jgi:hypothetical protein
MRVSAGSGSMLLQRPLAFFITATLAVLGGGIAVATTSPLSNEVHNAAVGICLQAKERLPQIDQIRRAPGTIGHVGGIKDVRVTTDSIVIDWEVRNVYETREFRLVLSGGCRISLDGRTLMELRVVP